MSFYRPAKAEDFQKPPYPLPPAAARELEGGQRYKAIAILRNEHSMGLHDAHKVCDAFASFIQAKRDFEDGKPVFTEYNAGLR